MADDARELVIPEVEHPTLDAEIDSFIGHVDSISDGFMIEMILAMQQIKKKATSELEAFEDEFCQVDTDTNSERRVAVPGDKYYEWKKHSKRVVTISISLQNLPRSLLVSLVSYFDAYLGGLIRTIYLRRPELLNASERKLTFEELTRFESIREVREHIIEKEVESVLRSSHSEQFRWMERIYDLHLTKGLDSWSRFIELMERRNLFVHTGGVVSSQYMSVCKAHNCELQTGVKEGDRLGVPQEYFEAANDCVFEIGVKLGHVLWRKMFPEEMAAADTHLVHTTYELLVSQRYQLAVSILDFACEGLKKHSSEVSKLMLVVNRALAYKWMGNEKSAKRAMKGVDWSAKSDEFKLANAVIMDDWDNASKFMLKVGPDAVTKVNYRHWPLFKEWRTRDEFKQAYSKIFGEDFDSAVEFEDEDSDDAITGSE